jgi:hypothetical protein
LLKYNPLEQSEPFTVIGSTLIWAPPPPPVTVRVVVPETPPDTVVIVVVPVATGVAMPLLPATLLIVATDVADELQVAETVRSCVVLPEKVPVALNCWVVPIAMLGFVGLIVSDTSVAPVTVRVVVPERPPDTAVIVVTPAATGVALPLLPATLLMVAMDVADEPQVADVVRS